MMTIYCFIRAPKIIDYDKKEVSVLSTHMDEVVGVQQKNCSFIPLTIQN